jgi:hypothetical protein
VETKSLVKPVARFLTTMLTGRAALVWSTTVPERVAVISCAPAGTTLMARAAARIHS